MYIHSRCSHQGTPLHLLVVRTKEHLLAVQLQHRHDLPATGQRAPPELCLELIQELFLNLFPELCVSISIFSIYLAIFFHITYNYV